MNWLESPILLGWVALHCTYVLSLTINHLADKLQHTMELILFVCLPWDLAYAKDIFQCMMDQILDHCDGVTGIADDVIAHANYYEEHDRHLYKLMEMAHEGGFVVNGGKCAVKQPSLTFFGDVYDRDGTQPDPAKVSAVHDLPPPETPTHLHKFLSMVT